MRSRSKASFTRYAHPAIFLVELRVDRIGTVAHRRTALAPTVVTRALALRRDGLIDAFEALPAVSVEGLKVKAQALKSIYTNC